MWVQWTQATTVHRGSVRLLLPHLSCLFYAYLGLCVSFQSTHKLLHSSSMITERVSETVGKCGFIRPKQQQFMEPVCGYCCPISAACSMLPWVSTCNSNQLPSLKIAQVWWKKGFLKLLESVGSVDPSNNSSWSERAVAAAPSQLLVLCLLGSPRVIPINFQAST